METLLTTTQAAERCNLSRRTLEKFRHTGGGPRYTRLGRAVRYRAQDLDAWVAENYRRSTSDNPGASTRRRRGGARRKDPP